jgi:osmotically-inducible protein OsmY
MQLSATETLNLPVPMEVSVQGATATLRGVVASARDREMAELLVRFEPGISTVRNELTVQQARPREEPRSPSSATLRPPGS